LRRPGAIGRHFEMNRKVKIAQFGLGPIGLECLKLAALKSWARIVGGVDIDSAKIGEDLGRLATSKSLRGLRAVGSLNDLEETPDLVFHTAVSRFRTARVHGSARHQRGFVL
jgi:4-hydroxy-tetrahydrodipicolinate reductase